MSKVDKKILYIFRGDMAKRLIGDKNFPKEFLYGLNYIKKEFNTDYIIAPRGTKNGIKKIISIPEKFFSVITKLGLPLEIYPLFKNKINSSQIIFCVNETIGFGVLFWKLFGFLKNKKIICIVMSLPDRIKYFRWCYPVRWFISKMLKKASIILTLSKYVHKDLIHDFKLDPKKIKIFYFGTDNNFWKSLPNIQEKNFILSIGNDMNRDFDTLVNALPTNIRLKIITQKKLNIQEKKIEIISGISNKELRNLYNQCLFVVIPSIKLKNESSGLSCSLQAMACRKAAIISSAPPIEEIFEDNKHCLFYMPENSNNLKEKINLLYNDHDLRKKIADNAFKNIEKFTNKKMAQRLNEIISKI